MAFSCLLNPARGRSIKSMLILHLHVFQSGSRKTEHWSRSSAVTPFGWCLFVDRRNQSDISRREPSPIYSYRRVRPGDVGYTRRGRFHLLFSAGIPLGSRELGTDVPLTFVPLDIGPIISGEVRDPGYLRTNTVRQIGVDVGGSVAVAWCVCTCLAWLGAIN